MGKSTCSIFFCLILTEFLLQVELLEASCPSQSEKWKDIGGLYCYIIEMNENVNWNDALFQCYKAGGSLASFHNIEEVNRITRLVSGKPLHIGLRQNGDGTFEWADRSALRFKNWYSGEPSNKKEMCGEMYADSGRWNDISCEKNEGYICSARKDLPTSTAEEQQKVCPSSSTKWKNFGGDYCYFIEKSNKYTWSYASGRCASEGGTLASFHSAEVISEILQDLKDQTENLHIGYERTQSGDFVCTDGSVAKFLNWNQGEPNSRDEKCAELYPNSGKWNDVPCGKISGYICSVRKVTPRTTPDGLKMACPEEHTEWKDYGGDSCYFINFEGKRSWHKTDQLCRLAGGSLAVFHSINEVKLVLPHLKGHVGELHIGFQRSSNDVTKFKSADGSDIDFLNWETGEPNDVDEKCVEMYPKNGKWNDIPCSIDQYGICSTPKVPSCAGDVCKNGGSCRGYNQKGPLRCTCAEWYSGVTCEEKIKCAANTCKNGGSCTQDGINGVFRCSCKHGYKGLICVEKN